VLLEEKKSRVFVHETKNKRMKLEGIIESVNIGAWCLEKKAAWSELRYQVE